MFERVIFFTDSEEVKLKKKYRILADRYLSLYNAIDGRLIVVRRLLSDAKNSGVLINQPVIANVNQEYYIELVARLNTQITRSNTTVAWLEENLMRMQAVANQYYEYYEKYSRLGA